jgi:serine/threonine-protein kinase RsbW
MGLSHERRMNLRVAVGEIVTNAILHGNKEQPDRSVDISVCATSDEITIIVRDYGEGFSPESLPDPRSPELREQLGGRGIFLTTQLANAVVFERVAPGMQVAIIFHR